MRSIVRLIILVWWMTGVVIAKGFWPVTFAIVFAPYGMYRALEHFLKLWGVL